ncbi:MAG: hypothetical protein ACR2LJ_07625 [Acidimicrobiales bacterium]
MRRLFSVCSLLLVALAVPAATEFVMAAPAVAATSPCRAGEIAHVKSTFSPNPVTSGTDTTNTVTIWNCTNQAQSFTFKGNVFGPTNCPPGTGFGSIPANIAPMGKFVSKVTFPAPTCKGTYTQNIQVFQGTTLVAHQRITFSVT